MSNSLKQASAVLAGAILLVVTVLASAYATVPLVEFYHSGSDHYFVSADPLEIDALDRGLFAGWARTGYSWPVIPSTDHTLAGASPVCRFYGLPSAGLDSHFYSASPGECAEVETNFAAQWEFESDNVFQVYAPDLQTGACPVGTQPVYRTWNNRRDSNHRYTTDTAVRAAMVAKGYIAEGYGDSRVAMCAPTTTTEPPPPAAPFACSASARATNPTAGTSVQISSNCNAVVATYRWTNYSGTDGDPIVTSATPGLVTYTLTATSTSGKTANAAVTVNWQPAAAPPPTCVLSVSPSTSKINTYISVFAVCTSPPPYEYSGCGGGIHGSGSCHANSSTPGTVTYKVRATSSAGTGPWASVTVTWQP